VIDRVLLQLAILVDGIGRPERIAVLRQLVPDYVYMALNRIAE
jgi:hypothetical protein